MSSRVVIGDGYGGGSRGGGVVVGGRGGDCCGRVVLVAGEHDEVHHVGQDRWSCGTGARGRGEVDEEVLKGNGGSANLHDPRS